MGVVNNIVEHAVHSDNKITDYMQIGRNGNDNPNYMLIDDTLYKIGDKNNSYKLPCHLTDNEINNLFGHFSWGIKNISATNRTLCINADGISIHYILTDTGYVIGGSDSIFVKYGIYKNNGMHKNLDNDVDYMGFEFEYWGNKVIEYDAIDIINGIFGTNPDCKIYTMNGISVSTPVEYFDSVLDTLVDELSGLGLAMSIKEYD